MELHEKRALRAEPAQSDMLRHFDDLQFSMWHALSTSAIFFAILLDVFDNFNIAFALPPLRAEWHLTPVQVGFLGSIALLGLALGALIIPGIADRWGRKWPYVAAVTGFTVMSLACGFAQNFNQLLFSRFITGIFVGGCAPLSFTYLAEIAGRRFRGGLIAFGTIGSTVAFMCVPIAAASLIPIYGWRSIFYLSFALGVISLAWSLFILKESVPYLISRNRFTEAGQAIAFFKKRDFAGEPVEPKVVPVMPPVAVPKKGSYFLSLWRSDLRVVTIVSWTLNITTLFAISGIQIWMPTLLSNIGFANQSYHIVFIGSLGSLVGALLALLLVDRWGRKPLLLLSAVGTLVFFPLLGAMSTVTSIAIIIFFAQLWAAGIIFPALYAWVNENYPSEIRASGMGWCQLPGRLAGFLAPNIIGFVVAAGWGFGTVGLVLGAPSLVSAILVLGWVNETKGDYLKAN